MVLRNLLPLTCCLFSSFLSLATGALAQSPKPFPRDPAINTPPTYRNSAHPGSGQYTQYKLRDSTDRKHAVAEVRAVTANGSFVSRSLKVITGNGGSKIFETITGEDGLTFGVKDFTSGGLPPLLKLIEKQHPGAVKDAFGPGTPVLQAGWLEAHTGAVNDHGLVALTEVRVGLDCLLCNPQHHDEQLDRYVAESVEPSLGKFKHRKYRREFTLACLVGAANSGGSGGLEGWLSRAEKNTGSKKEDLVIPEFMRIYTMRDAGGHEEATRDLLAKVFAGKPGPLPGWDDLGHSGRRLRWIAEYFSWAKGKDFTKLGTFGPAS